MPLGPSGHRRVDVRHGCDSRLCSQRLYDHPDKTPRCKILHARTSTDNPIESTLEFRIHYDATSSPTKTRQHRYFRGSPTVQAAQADFVSWSDRVRLRCDPWTSFAISHHQEIPESRWRCRSI